MSSTQQTNTLYFSSIIKTDKRYISFWERLETVLVTNKINYSFITNTNDIWCRDYLPVRKPNNTYTQFVFDPSYLKWPEYGDIIRTQPERTNIESIVDAEKSKLIVDGGNVVMSKTKAILTERVLKENKSIDRETIIYQLKYYLGVDEVFLIPELPYEYTGHADGMVRFVDDNTLIISDFKHQSTSWKNRFNRALSKTGLNIITFPYSEHFLIEKNNSNDNYTARGVYINFAIINNIILFPQFGIKMDKEALNLTLKLYPKHKVIPINAIEIADEGGVLNCITWEASSINSSGNNINKPQSNEESCLEELLGTKKIDSEEIKNYVFSHTENLLHEKHWELIDDEFADIWNNELGIGSAFYWDTIATDIIERIENKKIIVPHYIVREVVELILSRIKATGGFME